MKSILIIRPRDQLAIVPIKLMWRENEHIKPTIPIPTPAPALLWLLGVVYHPAATISPFNTALPLVEPYPLY